VGGEGVERLDRPAPDALVIRSRVVELEMPVFSKVLNRAAVVVDGAAPEVG
jgi:hypothetical protein